MNQISLNREVTLGPVRQEYADEVFNWMCDPFVSRNLGLRNAPSLERTKNWINTINDDTSARAYAIHLGKKHVGNVVIDHVDDYLLTARLSIYIGISDARGLGVGTTGIYLAIQHVFQALNLHKIWLTVHSQNLPAISIYRKIGFILEGKLRDEFWLDGQRITAFYMGLLKPDFEHLQALWK